MKHLKSYENNNLKEELKPGYYVTLKRPNDDLSRKYNNFIDTHIAKIEEITGNHIFVHFLFDKNDTHNTRLEFDYVHGFKFDRVKLYAPTLNLLKLKIESEKYNI